jgi:hypothetical protein
MEKNVLDKRLPWDAIRAQRTRNYNVKLINYETVSYIQKSPKYIFIKQVEMKVLFCKSQIISLRYIPC